MGGNGPIAGKLCAIEHVRELEQARQADVDVLEDKSHFTLLEAPSVLVFLGFGHFVLVTDLQYT